MTWALQHPVYILARPKTRNMMLQSFMAPHIPLWRAVSLFTIRYWLIRSDKRGGVLSWNHSLVTGNAIYV